MMFESDVRFVSALRKLVKMHDSPGRKDIFKCGICKALQHTRPDLYPYSNVERLCKEYLGEHTCEFLPFYSRDWRIRAWTCAILAQAIEAHWSKP